MRRRLTFVLAVLVAAAALLGLLRGMPSTPLAVPVGAAGERLAAGAPAPVGQAAAVGSCADLESDRRVLAQEIDGLDPAGSDGNPALCLMYYPREDVYWAVIVPYDGAAQFRAAKADAARRLLDEGFDLCRIGTWGAYARAAQSGRLSADDKLDVPAGCRPQVVALDDTAARQLPAIQAAVGSVADATSQQMGWRPGRPLTILAVADPDTAITTYRRFFPDVPPDQAASDVQGGRSATLYDTVYGTAILLNLVRTADNARLLNRDYGDEVGRETALHIAHEYTHVAQGEIGGPIENFPLWFIEGQAEFQEERNGDIPIPDRRNAAAAVRAGSALHLADLTSERDWLAQAAGSGTDAVYSRAYAAVAYLVDTYGFDATVQLLRDNRDGSIAHFDELLSELTGLDLDGLDAAVSR